MTTFAYVATDVNGKKVKGTEMAEDSVELESEGLQAIATRVSTGDECSIIIEDGYSKPVEKKETTTWKAGTF